MSCRVFKRIQAYPLKLNFDKFRALLAQAVRNGIVVALECLDASPFINKNYTEQFCSGQCQLIYRHLQTMPFCIILLQLVDSTAIEYQNFILNHIESLKQLIIKYESNISFVYVCFMSVSPID